MILIRFLRLFRYVRDLELGIQKFRDCEARIASLESDLRSAHEALEEETRRAMLLQDRNDALQAENARVWDRMDNAVNNERFAYQSGINSLSQRLGEGALYQNAHMLPAERVPKPGSAEPMGHRIMPSQIVRQRSEQALREYYAAQTEQ